MGTVNTYRVLRDGLRVGDSVRHVGDLIPEASDWTNVAVWVREKHIEPTTCTTQEMEKHLKKYPAAKPTTKKRAVKKSTAGGKKKITIKKKKGKTDDGAGGRKLAEQSV